MTPYLAAQLVIASRDLSILKILRCLCKRSGIRRVGMERYVLQSLYSVIREVCDTSIVITYLKFGTKVPLRRETLKKGSKIEDLYVEIFSSSDDHMKLLEAYQHEYVVYNRERKMHFSRFYRAGYGTTDEVQCIRFPFETSIHIKHLALTFERRNYPLEPSYWHS